MRVKRILLIQAVLVLFCSCGEDYILEREPNNVFSQAQHLEPGKKIRGYLQDLKDRDFYAVTADSESVLDVEVSGVKGINLAIRLWEGGADPRPLKLIDDTRKSSPERFPNLYMKQPGTYYIEILHGEKDVKAASDSDYYTLTWKTREPGNEEMEPDDSMEQATTILPGTEMTGYYAPSYNRENQSKEFKHREEDWYTLDIQLDSDMPVLLDANLTGVQGINAELCLYGPDREQIICVDSGISGSGEEIRGVGIKKSGTYYLMVAGRNYESDPDRPYSLLVSFREHDLSKEMEPNNDINSATAILKDSISGEINPAGDADFFRYKAADEFGIYRIALDSTDNLDYTVGIYNSRKEKVLDINNFTTGAGELFPDMAMQGDFYLSVSAKSGGVSIGGYNLSVTQLSDVASMELEPNDTKAGATKVQGNKFSGYLSRRGDKDYFLVEYEDRVAAVFEIRGVRGAEMKVSVTDPLGYIIKSVHVDGKGMVNLSEMIDKKGYIIVESISERFDEPYTVTIRGAK